ncbi:hypothetical protein HHI36_004278 [Cryptolaemus montrouzieri]|uniref:Uncharacterized protein n=1 Tax=Cryptolaemus montrouzieri TaxID=559131 RepID=A0ABD2NR05_9CUCU
MKLVNTFDKEQQKYVSFIPCEVYKVDKFLKYFGGLDKNNLPLLPVLLGNDYIKKSCFSAFHRHIKLKKCKAENEQQKLIKSVINWLSHETLESAIAKILGRFKMKRREGIAIKLNRAMQGYLQVNSTLSQYLEDMDRSSIHMKKEHDIDILKIEPIVEDDEIESEDDANFDEESEIEEELTTFVKEFDKVTEDPEPKKIHNSSGENFCFSEKYRRCLLSQCFVDIKMRNTYFCISQIEDYSEPHSHTISIDILTQIHKILTVPCTKTFICVQRDCNNTLKKENCQLVQKKCQVSRIFKVLILMNQRIFISNC